MTHFVDAQTLAARNFTVPKADLQSPARRALMARSAALGFGLAGASLLGCRSGDGSELVSPTPGTGTNPTPPASTNIDLDILNFALNLEYLEAEFYLRAVNGTGLSDNLTTGTGTRGNVTGGPVAPVPFSSPLIREYANEIARDERLHVEFLRNALGRSAVARPAIDIGSSFTALFRVAGIIGANESFDPYANENNFLLAAFVFEDVGVTAYKGAARLVTDKGILEAAAGLLAVEAYHAGLVRTVLYARGYDTSVMGFDASLIDKVTRLSNARDSVDGATDLDQGIAVSGTAPNDVSNIVPVDANAIAFGRGADKVLNVVYLTPNAATAGGFFPNGVNGPIRASTAG